MCFSAEVSFASSATLAVIAAFCIKKSLNLKNHSFYLLLSFTPLFFALQQLLEGFVWIGLNQQNAFLITAFSCFYLFFAFFFWITWFPMVAYHLEHIKWKKNLFLALIFFGTILGLYLWLPILLAEGPRRLIETNVCQNSVCYHVASGGYFHPLTRGFFYIALGAFCLLSSDLIFRKFFFIVMLLAIIAILIKFYAWTSVWCFFSGFSSLYILYLLNKPLLR